MSILSRLRARFRGLMPEKSGADWECKPAPVSAVVARQHLDEDAD